MNKQAFEKTIAYIEQAKDVIMDDWLVNKAGCGTVGCLAGSAILANMPERIVDEADGIIGVCDANGKPTMYSHLAGEILGLDLNQRNSLFFTSGWPEEFNEAWHEATSVEDRKRTLIERIKHFMETGE